MRVKAPYPGLRPFERTESRIFFGREEQVDDLLSKLKKHHFLAVVGTSGCGKSSLIRAGLLPGIEKGYMGEVGSRWAIAEMRPGNLPFTRLAESLLADTLFHKSWLINTIGKSDKVDPSELIQKAPHFLEADLRRGPRGVHETLQISPLTDGAKLLILVDQFEEIFRYLQKDENEAAAFVSLLLEASTHSDVYIVITMRSDFLGDAARFQKLPEAINDGLYLTPRLTRDQLSEAIKHPARRFRGKVENKLVNRLLNEAGTDPDQLPLLQHALMRFWDQGRSQVNDKGVILTLEQYKKQNGLKGTLNHHANEAWNELNTKEKEIAEILFRSLTERTQSGKDIRHPVKLGEVTKIARSSVAEVVAVVEVFRKAGRNFLTPPLETELTEISVLDISHESLIRQWDRLQQWVEEENEKASMYLRLVETISRDGEYWYGADLALALKWRDKYIPTAEWCVRYHDRVMPVISANKRLIHDGSVQDIANKTFEKSMSFLTDSEDEKVRKEREVEERRENELKQAQVLAVVQKKTVKRTRWFSGVLGILVIAASGTAYWAFTKQQEAEQSRQKAIQSQNITKIISSLNQESGGDISLGDAIQTMEMAADNNDPVAAFNLARMYELGKGVDINTDKALHYYSLAEEQADGATLVNLATAYSKGKGVIKKNTRKAAQLYKKAIKNFDSSSGSSARVGLGKIEKSRGTKGKDSSAFKLFEEAANKGNSQALVELALLYKEGRGVNRNILKAIDFFKKASAKSNISALNALGEMYMSGGVVEQNLEIAEEMYRKAARLGDDAGLVKILTNTPYKNIEKKISVATELAKLGSPKHLTQLAMKFETGVDVDKDIEKAIGLYEKAADVFYDNEAIINLAYIYKLKGDKESKSEEITSIGITNKKEEVEDKVSRNTLIHSPNSDKNLVTLNDENPGRATKSIFEQEEKELAEQKKSLIEENSHLIKLTRSVHYIKSDELIQRIIDMGEVSLYKIAGSYLEGEKKEKDKNKAIWLYNKSSESGNELSSLKLSEFYYYGYHIKQDKNKAKYMLSKLHVSGTLIATRSLGEKFLYEGSLKRAEEYLSIAINKKDKKSGIIMGELASHYLYGINVDIDLIKAEKLYRIAAKTHKKEGYLGLARLYLRHRDNLNTAKSQELFNEIKDNSAIWALTLLGDEYRRSAFGQSDRNNKAIEVYKLAADHGDVRALVLLGKMYQSNVYSNYNINIDASEKYYRSALGKSSKYREEDLLGSLIESYQYSNPKKAASIIEELYNKNKLDNYDALAILGNFYLYGDKNVERNLDKAEEAFINAADKGHTYGLKLLAKVYWKEEKDIIKAENIYKKLEHYSESTRWFGDKGHMYLSTGNYKAAEEWYKELVNTGREASYYRNEIWNYENEYSGKKDLKKALNMYNVLISSSLVNSSDYIGKGSIFLNEELKDITKAKFNFRKAADIGDLGGINLLVKYHLAEKDNLRNTFDEVKSMCRELVSTSNKSLQFDGYSCLAELADRMATGVYVDKNITAADNIFEEIGGTSPGALLTIADEYYYGTNGREKNNIAAINLYKKSTSGLYVNITSMYRLAEIYDEGYGVDKDMEKATEYYSMPFKYKLEDNNIYITACNKLGDFYFKHKDYKNAEKQYRKAKEKGDYYGLYKIAKLLESRSKPYNIEKSIQLYHSLAEKNHLKSLLSLAYIYKYSNDSSKNLSLSDEYMNKIQSTNYNFNLILLANDLLLASKSKSDKLKSVLIYTKLNGKGHFESAMRLSEIIRKGKVLTRDATISKQYYDRALSLIDNEEFYDHQSINNIASLLRDGKGGFDRNTSKALVLYNKALNIAERNKAFTSDILRIKSSLAKLYSIDSRNTNSLNKAVTLYQEILNKNNKNSDALYHLGSVFEKLKDFSEAFTYYKKSSELNNERATIRLASLYQRGLGVSKDQKQAIKLYKQGSKNNYENWTITKLADSFRVGNDDYPKSLEQAFLLYRMAAKEDDERAQLITGKMYETGSGTEKNLRKALFWYKKAAVKQSVWGLLRTADMYQLGRGADQDQMKASDYVNKALATEDTFTVTYVMLILADEYAQGDGKETNLDRSNELIDKAMSNPSDPYALIKVAEMHESGNGVKQDLEVAKKLYDKAAQHSKKQAIDALDRLSISHSYKFEKIGNNIIHNDCHSHADVDGATYRHCHSYYSYNHSHIIKKSTKSKSGSVNVHALQRKLKALGYYDGLINGIVTPETRSALQRYMQERKDDNAPSKEGLPSLN